MKDYYFFFTRGINDPSGRQNYVSSTNYSSGNQASSQASRPSGNVPLNAMAYWRCTQMERRCKRKLVSRWSPETAEMRRPNSERNRAPSAFTGPRVSCCCCCCCCCCCYYYYYY